MASSSKVGAHRDIHIRLARMHDAAALGADGSTRARPIAVTA